MPQLKISLLGTPRVHIDDEPILIKRRKAVALLAYLAVTGTQCGRESLATMLSPEKSEDRARGELRRALAALKEAGLDPWLETNREFVRLQDDDDVWLDVTRFQQLVDASNGPDLSHAIDLYQGDFMAGFTLRGSAEFDNWQGLQTQVFQQKLLTALEASVEASIDNGEYDLAIHAAQHWVAADEFNEYAQQQLMVAYALSGQRAAALSQYETYADLLDREIAASPLPETTAIYDNIKQNRAVTLPKQQDIILGNMPPLPPLVVGREDDFAELRTRISEIEAGMKNPVVMQGWPGIGKTTLSATLAHDSQLRGQFADGVLWISLGNLPDLMVGLRSWAAALGIADELNSIEELSKRIAAFLADKQMLLVIDDIWEAKDFAHFDVGGQRCKTLATTRLNSIAESIVSSSDAIYKIPVLTDRAAFDLMRIIAPTVVDEYPAEVEKLVESMEGLPLAIQVAGRMLRAEMSMGWGIGDLLAELSDGARLLEEQAPADRVDLIDGASPSVAILLKRSTDHLDELSRERFALLGVFAPKPATFDLKAIAAVWQADNPRPTVRKLVDRGLMEPIGGGYFQIHALLVAHARAMVEG